jgi:hypothetical protein
MNHRTPLCVMAKRLVRDAVDAIERKLFLDVDLDATARGWRVSRPRPFVRSYRDERWVQLHREDGLTAGSAHATTCRRRGRGDPS